MSFTFVVGFDFGTSYSKVVVRELGTGLARAVTFGPRQKGLLPSCVRAHADTMSGPLTTEEEGFLITYPKLIAADAVSTNPQFTEVYDSDGFRALESQYGIDFRELTGVVLTRYFLTVLQGVKDFIPRQQNWIDFEPESDPVIVQIAVPTGLLDSKSSQGIDSLILRALKTAMHRSRTEVVSGRFPIRSILETYRQIDELSGEEKAYLDGRCFTFAEVAAGVQTVFRSRSMPAGKYITMDVGAGTVDLNVFYRGEWNPSYETNTAGRLDYWSCRVGPFGAARIGLSKSAAHETVINTIPQEALYRDLRILIDDLVGAAFSHQPPRIKGHGISPWSENTYVYAWGGGIGHPGYGQTLATTLQNYQIPVQSPNLLPIPSDDFPLPADVPQFGRLAIAFGLSFHFANLEKVRLPEELKTFAETYPEYWHDSEADREICHCQANPSCPRCNGTGFLQRRPLNSRINVAALAEMASPRYSDDARHSPTGIKIQQLMDRFAGISGKPSLFLADKVLVLREIAKLSQHSVVLDDDSFSAQIKEFQNRYLCIRGEIFVVPYANTRESKHGVFAQCYLLDGNEKQLNIVTKSATALVAYIHSQSGCEREPFVRLDCQCIREKSGKYMLKCISVPSPK